jgi:hypothetical protein
VEKKNKISRAFYLTVIIRAPSDTKAGLFFWLTTTKAPEIFSPRIFSFLLYKHLSRHFLSNVCS